MHHRVLAAVVPLLLFAAVVLGSVPFAHAQVTNLPINKCLVGKIKSVGKSLAARTGCFSKQASTGVASTACLEKASSKSRNDFMDPPRKGWASGSLVAAPSCCQ